MRFLRRQRGRFSPHRYTQEQRTRERKTRDFFCTQFFATPGQCYSISDPYLTRSEAVKLSSYYILRNDKKYSHGNEIHHLVLSRFIFFPFFRHCQICKVGEKKKSFVPLSIRSSSSGIFFFAYYYHGSVENYCISFLFLFLVRWKLPFYLTRRQDVDRLLGVHSVYIRFGEWHAPFSPTQVWYNRMEMWIEWNSLLRFAMHLRGDVYTSRRITIHRIFQWRKVNYDQSRRRAFGCWFWALLTANKKQSISDAGEIFNYSRQLVPNTT